MKLKKTQRKIFKLHSTLFRQAKWNLNYSVEHCRKYNPKGIVELGESQQIRWIDELNGTVDVDEKAKVIARKIKNLKAQPKSRETKTLIKQLYAELDQITFLPDYLCIIMDKVSDYHRLNKGFTLNGIKFRRLLGTNGGIKKSTVVYINEELYPAIKERIDNGRNKDVKLVPAKLESYQALTCSMTVPVPEPRIIVVDDCITRFTDDVYKIDDSGDGEPKITFEKGFEVEHNNSDGCGLMSPEYALTLNVFLNDVAKPLSGCNTRYAWTKGMIGTFDFVEFAEKVAGTYVIKDAWGDDRDVREADVILTTSMVKLWNCYENFEQYHEQCKKNHYQFCVAKTCPEELEDTRYMNYQFLQSYDFTDEELRELCQPTIDEFKDILGFDYRKTLLFSLGYNLAEDVILRGDFETINQALMIEPAIINDPYIRKKIWGYLENRINGAKKGSIRVNANFAMIFGDLYALAQSVFGLEVTGLLKAGEIYHKYWIDKGADEVVCYRAPMTCHNNIRKAKLNKSEDVSYWFQYINTAVIFNAFDTTCDAMNGCDFDGDTAMCTDSPVLLKKTMNTPTIMCLQRGAEKKDVTEEMIVDANVIAFNDDIGKITNYVTAMFERQAGYEKDSKEYKELEYRIMCGQNYQQNTIDRAKGIITKPMPAYWYRTKPNNVSPEDDAETIELKNFRQSLVAYRKPYFMIYVYKSLKKELKTYLKNTNRNIRINYMMDGIKNVEDLRAYENRTPEMEERLKYYDTCYPVGMNPCVVNRIAWMFEDIFDGYLSSKRPQPEFDYSILKSGVEYTDYYRRQIEKIHKDYFDRIKSLQGERMHERLQSRDVIIDQRLMREEYIRQCYEVCPNAEELCDIIVDICYESTKYKAFAWDIVGDQILKNLLKKNGNRMSYPVKDENGDFEYLGAKFKMETIEVKLADTE